MYAATSSATGVVKSAALMQPASLARCAMPSATGRLGSPSTAKPPALIV